MSKQKGINVALLAALGVQWQDQNILGATLRLRAGRFPTLTVHRIVTPKTQIGPVIERFELRPIKGAPTSPLPQPSAIPLEAQS